MNISRLVAAALVFAPVLAKADQLVYPATASCEQYVSALRADDKPNWENMTNWAIVSMVTTYLDKLKRRPTPNEGDEIGLMIIGDCVLHPGKSFANAVDGAVNLEIQVPPKRRS